MGEWLGDTAAVVQKMSGAYDLVAERGAKSALTLYFNQDYWAQANVPNRMKTGLDYVWISDYEDDCNGLQPAWEPVFKKRAEMFPSSRVGFGEVGTKYSDRKEGYIDR